MTLADLTAFAAPYPWLETLWALALLVAAAAVANLLVKPLIVRVLARVFDGLSHRVSHEDALPVARRLANILPAVVIAQGIVLVPHLPVGVVTVTRNVCSAFVILMVVLALSAALNLLNDLYQRRPTAMSRPIKGYLQVVKILLFAAAAVLMAAALMERSPLLLLSGLGAMAAVLMLVFKDTILSLVASVQIASNDMVRLGDWVEMPQLNADGDVIDIALHTVKIQNWDKTITTIPTQRLITDSFKNWRGMQESGGRRIKRALMLDQTSVRFLADEDRERLRRMSLIADYLDRKQAELDAWNQRLLADGRDPVNTRQLTNLGTFRAYVQAYLEAHPTIARNMTLLVRQLQPTPEGLPIEIYCFTATTAWAEYEGVQSDIFDHLYAVLPEFGLRVFQAPTGLDLQRLAAA
ncbi:small-conductance mechanosensitive channel [Phenylobacterium zucineum HLK1]|uniref:Mechanosensing system component YbdG n=1 Tax=Phenylobacterium zucineum (strain HLK1) TaxID=450851 RepID=B4R977_PHEZH|nr:mechanosensitive ion channel domain-containing protein [Phenylobacterium zucineum]ACG77747.1 small-conductance mechanosensitive channel [Phenylobacterium zucineum HLK1]